MDKKPTYEELEQRVDELKKEAREQKRLDKRQRLLSLTIEQSSEGIAVVDLNGNLEYLNDAFANIHGYSSEELVGKHLSTFHTHAQILFVEAANQQVKETGSFKGEIWHVRRDGTLFPTLMHNSLLRDEAGNPIGMIGTLRDMTAFKLAEEKTKASEVRYRELFNNMSSGVAIYEAKDNGNDFIFRDFNRSGERIENIKKEDLIGKSVLEVFPGAKEFGLFDVFKKVWESGKPENHAISLYKDERITGWRENYVYKLPSGEIVAVYDDITERKRAEEDLKQFGKQLQLLLNTMIDYCYIVSKDHKIEFMNKALKDKLGDQTGKICYEAFFGLESSCPWSKLERVIAGETVRWEHYLPELEGFFEIIDTPLTNKDGTVSKLGLLRDITDRKQAEDALREGEEKYRLLFNKSNDSVLVYQLTKDHMPINFIDVNDVACKKLGYTREELLKLTPLDIISPKDHDLLPSIIRKLRKGKSSLFESIHITKDGRELPVNINPNIFEFHGEPTVLCVARDISERKQAEKGKQQLEAQLQQAQRMEAIGTLAGGVAHDFNNLLMGIQGRASLMLMNTDSSHPHFEHLQGIEEYVTSAADLTRQLLGFARGGKYEVKPTDINEMIKKSSSMFGRTKKEIKIHRKYQKDVWTIETDHGQIDQVLMNLYVNAWQAMSGGGELYLQTENVTLDEDYVKPFKIEPGGYVKISVTDTGVGMDEATRQRIFEPFFTTKEMGRGAGLGLASAYGIIKNHSGFINVYSKKGEGTTFNIYLPASESEVSGQKSEISEDVRHGDETVLLVDDEEMIIDVGGQLLEKMGYKVLTARSGKEATELYEKNKDRIDLIILDMIMPDMSGGDTFDRLKEINPEIKVLLSSGYSINGQATEILERGCNGFIQKPFNMKQLSRKLREILEI